MAVKQQLEIIDKPAFGLNDIDAIDQKFCLYKNFGTSCAGMVAALIDENPVVWRYNQIMFVVQSALFDHNGGKGAGGADGLLTDPTDFPRSMDAGQNTVAHGQLFDWFL